MAQAKRNSTIKTTRPAKPAAAELQPARIGKWFVGNAEWEAMKASCRNLRPADAVRECADLSAFYRRKHRVPDIVIDFDKIIATLQKKENSVRVDRGSWHCHLDGPAAFDA
jgi:hypothetical protein